MTGARSLAIVTAALTVALSASSSFEARAANAPAPHALTDAQKQAARELFQAGERDEDANRWADALEKFRRVAAVKLTAGVRYHIALCEEHLGQLVAALGEYTVAETQARAENAQDVLPLVGEKLKSLKTRVPRLTVVVPGDTVDAEVRLDGDALVKELWGVPVPLDPGDHRLEAQAPGRAPMAVTITLEERQATLFEVKLAKVTAPPAAVPSTESAPPKKDSDAGAGAVGSGASGGGRGGRGGAILATVSAAVLAGGGVVAYLVAGQSHDDGQTECATRHLATCDDLKQSVRTWDALALGGFIGGAVLGTVAIVLWTRPSGGAAPATTRGQIVIGPGTLGVHGAF